MPFNCLLNNAINVMGECITAAQYKSHGDGGIKYHVEYMLRLWKLDPWLSGRPDRSVGGLGSGPSCDQLQ